LGLLLSNGARLAQKGEFSKRAFLNNKIDLIKAEAIHDLIFAKTQEQAELSVKKFDGQTSNLINNLQSKILKLIATIEINIDYPEYDDVEILTQKKLLPKLKEILKEFDEIIYSSRSSRYIFNGINVVIIGKPNVGKSSLLNAILNEEKAIVTKIPGTTRDVVEGSIQIGQVLLNFKDTAGIHSTKNLIENIGIKKSIKQIEEADLIIHLIDAQNKNDKDDILIKNKLKNKKYIKVFNKNDLVKSKGISISAKNKDIKSLIDSIKKMYKDIDLNNNKIINNTRQLSLIISSQKSIKEAIKGLENNFQPDTVIIDIQKA
jgi:tRNA modification GTPase